MARRTGINVGESRPGEVVVPAGVALDDGLSEAEAVVLAVWNNAAFRETLAELGLAHADLVQAGMLPNPTLSLLVPVGAKPLDLTVRYPFEVLWQRPRRVAAAKLDYERTAERLGQAALDLVRDARVAFAEVALAQNRLRWAQESVRDSGRIAELTQARLRAGDVSPLESSQAESDVGQAREQVLRLRQEALISGERLRHLLGLGLSRWPEHFEASPGATRARPSAEICVTNALATRPDLRAAELGLEAAGKRIGLARLETFTLAAGVNAKDIGTPTGNEFLAGPALDFALPILNQNQGGVALAKARFEQAARRYYNVRDRIVLEVREAHARLELAQASQEQWRQNILPPLEAAVRQAEQSFSAGNVSQLFVAETHRRWTEAEFRAAAVEAEFRRAAAELARSVGQDLAATTTSTPP